MKYLIIGCSAAGVSAAQEIRKNDLSGEITIVTGENYKAYGRPLISYYLKDKVNLSQIDYKEETFYDDKKINLITGKIAVSVSAKDKKVTLDDGTVLSYDKLLLATGSEPFIPQIDNINGKENVFTFMNMKNSVEIKNYASKEMNAVIIGGGLIGMKAAEGLKKICKSVTVLELSNQILPTILDFQASGIVRERVEDSGIICYTGDTAVKVNGNKKIESVILKSGKEIPCDILVVAVGVRPCTELARQAGCNIERGITIDENMMTTVDGIYAAGDCVVSCDKLDGKEKIIALWPTAVKQGKAAAVAMIGGNEKYLGGFAMNAIDLFSLHILTAGVIGDEDDGYEVKIICDGRNYRRFSIKNGLLKGFILVGDISRGGLYTTIISEEIQVESLGEDIFNGAQLIKFDKEIRNMLIERGDRA